MTTLEQQGRAAKDAARILAAAGSSRKDAALETIAQALEARLAREKKRKQKKTDRAAARKAGSDTRKGGK